jgi:hypothetical protein
MKFWAFCSDRFKKVCNKIEWSADIHNGTVSLCTVMYIRAPLGSPAAPRGAGLSARRLVKSVGEVWNRTYPNVEAYGWSENETARKCILQAEKHYAWRKKTPRRTFVSLGKTVFSLFSRKKKPFFLRKQKFASEFFCTWHNVSSQKEHIFLFLAKQSRQSRELLLLVFSKAK